MKKAVITICGLIGGYWEKDSNSYQLKINYADYGSENIPELISDEYINMLPLLIRSYPSYDIIPLATKDAKTVQKLVLEKYGYLEKVSFQDINEKKESEYSEYFKTVNKLINEYDEIIVDLSHGFRHIPLLTLIALITQNIQKPDKIKHILFAQEIVREKKYQVIDLIEYLDLANLSFLLSTFNQNYTVSNNIQFKNENYTKISDTLRQFSDHFLSNSLKPLLEGRLVADIIEQLTALEKHETINHFTHQIDEICVHLKEIQDIKEKKHEWERLHVLSKIMSNRGYLLNAITLLFEAVGFYCVNNISHISKDTNEHIDYFKKHLLDKKKPEAKFSLYALINQSRNIVKLSSNDKTDETFKGDYLYNPETIKLSDSQIKHMSPKPKAKINLILGQIKNYINGRANIKQFQAFIRRIEALRNNLAHGNTSGSLNDIKNLYTAELQAFEKFCIEDDILSHSASSTQHVKIPHSQVALSQGKLPKKSYLGTITTRPKVNPLPSNEPKTIKQLSNRKINIVKKANPPSSST